MGRPRGSKNKSPLTEKGNPSFNLKDAIPVNTDSIIASSAITDEDMALDRELDRIARNSEPEVSDKDEMPLPVKKTIDPYTMLSDFEDDYKPAETIQELDDQVFRAKHYEADSIEASSKLIKYFCKKDYPDKVGYFVYHDIKVYIAGFFEQSKVRDQQTIEQKIFGEAKTT